MSVMVGSTPRVLDSSRQTRTPKTTLNYNRLQWVKGHDWSIPNQFNLRLRHKTRNTRPRNSLPRHFRTKHPHKIVACPHLLSNLRERPHLNIPDPSKPTRRFGQVPEEYDPYKCAPIPQRSNEQNPKDIGGFWKNVSGYQPRQSQCLTYGATESMDGVSQHK